MSCVINYSCVCYAWFGVQFLTKAQLCTNILLREGSCTQHQRAPTEATTPHQSPLRERLEEKWTQRRFYWTAERGEERASSSFGEGSSCKWALTWTQLIHRYHITTATFPGAWKAFICRLYGRSTHTQSQSLSQNDAAFQGDGSQPVMGQSKTARTPPPWARMDAKTKAEAGFLHLLGNSITNK